MSILVLSVRNNLQLTLVLCILLPNMNSALVKLLFPINSTFLSIDTYFEILFKEK